MLVSPYTNPYPLKILWENYRNVPQKGVILNQGRNNEGGIVRTWKLEHGLVLFL